MCRRHICVAHVTKMASRVVRKSSKSRGLVGNRAKTSAMDDAEEVLVEIKCKYRG